MKKQKGEIGRLKEVSFEDEVKKRGWFTFKESTPQDHKLCKLCWFEASNGHAHNCPNRII